MINKMEIIKARKDHLKEYIKLKKDSLNEYSKIAGTKIILTNNQIKKELFEAISNPERILLFIKDKELKGYIIGSIVTSEYNNYGYIDDIFISRKFRKKGLATYLINNFILTLKRMKIKKIRLGVNINNKGAIKFYKKIGFEIKHYEMDKVI